MPNSTPPVQVAVDLDHPALSVPGRQGMDYASWFIMVLKRFAIRRYRFPPDEADDMGREIVLHLMEKWPQFDEETAKATTFIQNIVRARFRQIVRTRFAPKRDIRREAQMSYAAEFGLLDGVRGQPHISDHELIELREDVQSITSRLPDELKQIAALLQEMTPSEAAIEMGMTHGTFWSRMAELRQHFAAEGYGPGGDSPETSDQENA